MIKESRWKALFFIYLMMLVFAFTFQSIPPVLGFLTESLGITHAQAGALMSLFALPGILISIPGGVLADVYGPKRVGVIALSLAVVGTLLVGLGNSFSLILVGRLISGIGAMTIAVVAPQTLSRWFVDGHLGKAMGIFNTAMPLGTIFSLNIFGRLGAAGGWRAPILLTAAYSFFVLLMFWFKYPSLPGEQQEKAKPEFNAGMLVSGKMSIWLIAVIWMMYNAAAISYLTFGGDYYLTVGYGVSYAGFLTSLLMVGSLLFSPLVGSLTDRFGREEYFIIGGSLMLALLLFLVPRAGLNPLLLGGMIGLFAASVPAPVFALVPKRMPMSQVGLGYGILSTCLNIGVLVGPLLIGLSYDRVGHYIFGFNIMAIFALFTAAPAVLLLYMGRSNLGQKSMP